MHNRLPGRLRGPLGSGPQSLRDGLLGPAAYIKPITLGHRFSLSLHGGNGPQVRKLFDRYLPQELANALDTLDERIDLDMKSSTVADLIAQLDQLARGTPSAT